MLAAYAAALSLTTPSLAKTPGEIHCYNGICHRVKSVDEMNVLVGMETESLTSFYDSAEHDSMNAGTITSSGEEFDADSDTHAASAYYPDGTELLVWNPKNRRAAHIRVNDFGPFYMLRTIDVTRGVAEKLDFVKSGVAKLRIIVIWAPGRAEASYRRLRQYPAVEGYLGAMDTDQLSALKYRLISTAAVRNGQRAPMAEASVQADAPRYSLISLPAYVAPGADNAAARRIAAIMNAPRFAVGPTAIRLTVTASAAAHEAVTAIDAPAAVDVAPSQPAIAVSVRQSAETTIAAIADVVRPDDTPAQEATVALTLAAQSVSAKQAAGPAMTLAAFPVTPSRLADIVTASVWPANPHLWQQLLAALGLLSLTAVTLRRQKSKRLAPVPAHRATAAGPSAAPARASAAKATAPFELFPAYAASVPAGGPVAAPIVLPHLPSAPAARSLADLRDEAIAAMERYAYPEAEAAYRALLSARERELGVNDPLSASAERQLADCLREQGRFAAAEPHYHRALSAMSRAAGEMHPATADVLDEYATSVLRQGYASRAESLARQSLAVRRATHPRGREQALTLSIVAETLRAQGQLVAAEIEHRAALNLLITECGPESLEVAAAQLNLGALLGELGRFAAAEDLLNQATRRVTNACGANHPAAAMSYSRLGELYRCAGAFDSSLAMHTHALDIRHKLLGARHPDTIESLLMLSQIAAGQYRTDTARVHLERALDGLIGAERTHFGPQSRTRSMLVGLSHHFETTKPRAVAAE